MKKSFQDVYASYCNFIICLLKDYRTEMKKSRLDLFHRLIPQLLLSVVPYLSQEDLICFSSNSIAYSQTAAASRIKRLAASGCIQSVQSSDSRYFYHLTPAGRNDILRLLQLLYGTDILGCNLTDITEWIQILSTSQSPSMKEHAIAEYYTIVSLIHSLSNTPETDYQISKESGRNPFNGIRLEGQKTNSDIISDISFQYRQGSFRSVFLEVDLSTERPSGPTGIRKKLDQYSILFSRYHKTEYFTSSTLIFPVFSSNANRKKEAGSNAHDYKAIQNNPLMQLLLAGMVSCALSKDTDPKELKIKDAIEYITQNENDISCYLATNSALIKDLKSSMDVIQAFHPDGKNMPLSLYGTVYREYLAQSRFRTTTLIEKSYEETARRRQHTLWNIVSADIRDRMLYGSGIGSSLAKGLSLAAISGKTLDLSMLLPDLYYHDHIALLFEKIGLISSCHEPGSHPLYGYCIPLQGRNWTDSNGISYTSVRKYLRLVYKAEDILIAIENLSDDIGGFIRAKEFLSLPPGFQKKIFLLGLIADDEYLADGSVLSDGTLFTKELIPQNTSRKGSGAPSPSESVHPSVIAYHDLILQYALMNEHYDLSGGIPYLISITQCFGILTYSGFRRIIQNRDGSNHEASNENTPFYPVCKSYAEEKWGILDEYELRLHYYRPASQVALPAFTLPNMPEEDRPFQTPTVHSLWK